MTKTESKYYPNQITLETLPNKLYLLSWMQNDVPKRRLLNKAKAFAMVNDHNVDIRIRDELVKAFRAGEIA